MDKKNDKQENNMTMKKLKKTMGVLFLTGLTLAGFPACSSEELEGMDNTDGGRGEKHTCVMHLKGGLQSYENAAPRAGRAETATEWQDGDKIYLTFTSGSATVPGEAVYDGTTSSWVVSYYGTLASGEALKCEAVYFDGGSTGANPDVITLDQHTAIYRDTEGIYTFSGGDLEVSASLAPVTGRIRFTGVYGTKLYVSGLSHYTRFDVTTNTFVQSDAVVTETVADDSTTPYIYGFYTNDKSPYISVLSGDNAYTMNASAIDLSAGKSGYMAVPVPAAHNGWSNNFHMTVKGVDFNMIVVAGLSSGNFCIGETEVTQQLYSAVTGSNPSTNKSRPDLPVETVSYYQSSTFNSMVSTLTGLTFSMPAQNQWKYAAKGGNKSLEYTYSGSNTIGDVAWYDGNSNNTTHPVKTKKPNELGIYDMSGNVMELTYYNSSYGYLYGGSFDRSSTYCMTSSNYYGSLSTDYANNYVGLRLYFSYN